jgi:hypothetical protein
VIATFSLFEHAHSVEAPRQQHATAALYADSLLLGIQLGAKQGAAAGTVKSSVANCIMALDASSLTDVVEAILVKNLTPAELEAAGLRGRSPTIRLNLASTSPMNNRKSASP